MNQRLEFTKFIPAEKEPQGVITVRLPLELHCKLKALAKHDKTSLNQTCIAAIKHWINAAEECDGFESENPK